jgi:uncharacterized membrane protein YeiB
MSQLQAELPNTTRAAPVSDAQRLRVLDALRGVALLGILLMNIPGFAMPDNFSESFKSDPKSINCWLNAVITVFFEGKMRALFGMVFGAGVLLFVAKKEQTGKPVTGLFYRRMIWPNYEAMLSRMETVPVDWVGLIYRFQRILLVMAHVSTIILLYKSRYVQPLFRRLEAVGQMALTNYIMQSVICTLVFFGYGLNYYAALDFYQIYFIVLAIWALQLIVSPLWLRFFFYGPLEWVWRSLTYWRRQSFRRSGGHGVVMRS